jgi:hypothetical protein
MMAQEHLDTIDKAIDILLTARRAKVAALAQGYIAGNEFSDVVGCQNAIDVLLRARKDEEMRLLSEPISGGAKSGQG